MEIDSQHIENLASTCSSPCGNIPTKVNVSNPYQGLQGWSGPAILLVDLDAFFASVEQLDHPAWRGKPVIVGGDAARHGVVSTASYEARRYGVHSAMPASQAARLCPDAIWAAGRYDRYKEVSNLVMSILHDETPLVQQVSIDEAFVDVTPTRTNREHPVQIASRIQKRVESLGVTCSIGVGTTKTVAKIASDMDKPRGLTIVFPSTEQDFLRPLPVKAMSGVGAAAAERLRASGIETIGDLADAGEARLTRMFGKNGKVMYLRACGLDDAPVAENGEAKSVSAETTFAAHLTKREDVEAAISTLAVKVGRRLRAKSLRGSTISLKVRFHDRSTHSVQQKLSRPTDDELLFGPKLHAMLDKVWNPGTPVLLIGVGVSGFENPEAEQACIFDADELCASVSEEKPLIADNEKRRGLLNATDAVKDRFGENALKYGHQLRNANNTTGATPQNPTDYK
jgi:DNA polymerase IV